MSWSFPCRPHATRATPASALDAELESRRRRATTFRSRRWPRPSSTSHLLTPATKSKAALNEADIKKLIKLASLRAELERLPPRPGLGKLKKIVDMRTFAFTRSELERAMLRLVRTAGLPKPLTRVYIGGREFDFFLSEHRLLIETNGATFHRSPFRQGDDARRNNIATLGQLRLLRFTHGQLRYERAYVLETLRDAGRAA